MSGLGEIKRCLKCGGEMENFIFGYVCFNCKRNKEKKLEQEKQEKEEKQFNDKIRRIY